MSKQFDEDKIREYREVLADVTLAHLDAMIFPDSTPEQREAVRREIAERQECATQLITDAVNLRF